MASIGPIELIVLGLLLVLAVCFVGFIIFVGARVVRARGPFGGAGSNGSLDLATKVRGLKAQGRFEQAMFLVRGETGFSEEEARSFVERA
ncbi:hypothetical protein Pth03_40210 [Planotetraspora thailandica]|uniref:Uncharacterized protein n=1 Tax=Planotetraspora thailandica TaxID=487172 RepID=A0A8J3V4Y9_9ACTN|nr:hypothetical protein [Planotetraspora thailandica]GII55632.1 hypothetical protein Pth03_40210 [Planotetraspora thailandica]